MERLMMKVASVISAFIFLQVTVCEGATGSVYSKKLFKKLFEDEGYNHNVRPVLSVNTVTEVRMLLYVAQVLDMDERQQTLTTNMWVTYVWKDEFIHWDPEEWGNVTKLKVDSELLWMPDITLYNCAADNYIPYLTKKICIIYNDGNINWASPVIMKSHCNIDVTHFPFDKQSCELKFGPWQYDGTEVNLTGTGDTSVFISDGEWDMKGLDVRQDVNFYPDAPGIPYTDVVYTMHFKRRSLYYVFNLVMPCVLVAGITILGFVLPADSGEKVSLGITVLLSLTVFLLLIAESMPPSSHVPVIGQYYAATMLLVSISIMLTVIVLNLHHRGPTCRPVPRWMRRIFLNKLAPILRLHPRPSQRNKAVSKDHKIFMRMQESETSIMDLTTPLHQNHQTPGDESPIRAMHNTTRNLHRDGPERACCRQQIDILRRMMDHMRVVREHYDSLDHSDFIRGEWKQVAQVVDRLFMIFYILGTISTLLIIFIQLS
ncbi:neuronal acetylcholine receptor subunit alpha-10-like [Acanthaster planci]|uniref:Neuronal acetylcholine receptor subunit alpha-10-like n=1 Tax=Acanthaster planci TaxID=133434 RepID=A0A8B7Y7C0_ACAPL|nr:neuronal acetylcholine receptor subunit alpha-10-like [Acanthaster planci]